MSSPSQAGENVTVTLPIEGMTCAACQSHVEHALKGTPGVSDARRQPDDALCPSGV